MFFVERLDFFVGNRIEQGFVDVGSDDFQREQLRLSEAGLFRVSTVDNILVLLIERARLVVGRIGDLGDVIARLEDGDFSLRHTVQRGVSAKFFGGRNWNGTVSVSHLSEPHLGVEGRHAVAAVIFANHTLVGDLLFDKIAEHFDAESGGSARVVDNVVAEVIVCGAPFVVEPNESRQELEVFDDGVVVRNEFFSFRIFQNEPARNERFSVGRRIVDLHTQCRQFSRRHGLQLLRRRRQIIQERLQTNHFLTQTEELVVIERSEFLRLCDFADELRAHSLVALSHALEHRAQSDKRKHRKEGQPRHPGLLVAAEYAKRVMFFGHWNCLSYADLMFARSPQQRRQFCDVIRALLFTIAERGDRPEERRSPTESPRSLKANSRESGAYPR